MVCFTYVLVVSTRWKYTIELTTTTVTKRENESRGGDGVRTATSSQPIQLSAVEALSDQRSKSTSLVTEVAIPWLLASTPIAKATVAANKSIGTIGSCP